jgi:carboxyl-terminal processing protease
VELPDGSAVKLTIARYYTPKGRSIDGKGIIPNIVLNEATWRQSLPKDKGKKGDSFYDFQKDQAVRQLRKMTQAK